MQGLYAYQQQTKTEIEVLFEQFLEEIQNIPDFYEKPIEERKLLLQTLKSELLPYFEDLNVLPDKEAYPWLNSTLDAQRTMLSNRLKNIRKKSINEELASLENAWQLFAALLYLVTEVASYALTDEFEKQNKHLNKETSAKHQMKILKNKIVLGLQEDKTFAQQGAKSKYKFCHDEELIRKLFKEVLFASTDYQTYRNKLEATEEEEVQIIKFLYRKILKHSLVNDQIIEEDLNWQENKILIEVLAKDFFKNALEDQVFTNQYLKYKQILDEDKGFLMTLYEKSIDESPVLEEMINEVVKNWNLDRMAVLDLIILKLAMVEMEHNPHIPVKVSINEFLEISKNYSTPGSALFLNGMMDKLSQNMKEKQMIRKSAKGMIDNK